MESIVEVLSVPSSVSSLVPLHRSFNRHTIIPADHVSSDRELFPQSLSDEDLLSRAVRGDHAAFGVLAERHGAVIRSTVVGMLGAGSEAEDIVQETLIKVYQTLDRFRGESSLRTYITRIAINLSLNALRRQRRYPEMLRAPDPDSDGEEGWKESRSEVFEEIRMIASDVLPPDSQLESQEAADLIRRAVQSLKPGFRAVVVLRLIDGFSTKETAEMLDLPIGTVLSRLARAQDMLKTLLNSYY